jgi:hypothetical protein
MTTTDTRSLLGRIAALRQRLDRARGDSPTLPEIESPAPEAPLEQRVTAGERHQRLLNSSLRQLAGMMSAEETVGPSTLTARARRLVEQGRTIVARLRQLGGDPLLSESQRVPWALISSDGCQLDPLLLAYHETSGMIESAMRLVQAFPDTPSVQLRLCDGLEGLLAHVEDRTTSLTLALTRRHNTHRLVETVANYLSRMAGGETLTGTPFGDLATQLLAEAADGEPIRFLACPPGPDEANRVRAVACHALTSAQIMARLVSGDAEWGREPHLPVIAALVANVGMLRVDPAILSTPGPLTDEQTRQVEQHARIGGEIVSLHLPEQALGAVVAAHHERLDGSGYPDGLSGHQVPELARLLAVVDHYAAMTCPRPHRAAIDPRTALTDTLLFAEQGRLDRSEAEKLLRLAFYPTGSLVELADGSAALVVANHPPRRDHLSPARPALAVLTDERGRILPSPRPLDLAASESGSVVRTLPPERRGALLGRRYPEWL